MSKISASQIQHLAALSKLYLSDEEVEKYRHDVAAILSFIDQLQAVDVSNYEPTDQVSGLKNVLRADMLQDFNCQPSDITQHADMKDDQFLVKRVLN